MNIVARRGTADHPILVLEGVGDRTAAEALRGEAIAVPRAVLGTLDEGEFLVDDLVGCEVVDGERPVGRVQRRAAAALGRHARGGAARR